MDAQEIKAAVAHQDAAKALADLLAKANGQQKAAEDGLANLLERLEKWGAPGEVRGEPGIRRRAKGHHLLTEEAGALRPLEDGVRAQETFHARLTRPDACRNQRELNRRTSDVPSVKADCPTEICEIAGNAATADLPDAEGDV